MTPVANLNSRSKSINDAMSLIGPRFFNVLDNSYTRGDIIENDLSKEIENGRLFRLICKLNTVLERQELVSIMRDNFNFFLLKLDFFNFHKFIKKLNIKKKDKILRER